ncbi:tetratricopeptide repeat protein [candidate division WOR-3 bacterium]|nr:tetratricopeptide repeat protein [candidate division WOR-3 bacterium]
MKKFPLILLFLTGCIYYNTYYNAEKYYNEENYTKSIEKCKKILERHPRSDYTDDAIFLMGKSYYYSKKPDEAKKNFRRIVDFFPKSPFREESYLFLGKIAIEKKNLDEAIMLLNRVADSDDPYVRMETFKTKLELYLLADNPQKTIDEGEKFIEKYRGNSAEAYYIIGNANRLIGNREKALEMYKNALEENKEEPSGRLIYNLTALYFEMDSLTEALSIIEKGKNNDSLSLFKGEILMKLKDFDEATKSFESVGKRRDSLGTVAKYRMGEIKEFQRDTSDAIKLYKEAEDKGDFGEISEMARAKEEIFENISLLRNLSEKTKNEEEAEAEAEQNYEKKDSSYIFFRIGEIYYWSLKEKEEGVVWYRKVHKDFPESSYAPKAIFTLINIELSEDSTFSPQARELLSVLTEKYPNTKYSEKAKELYGTYFQDTTSSRE